MSKAIYALIAAAAHMLISLFATLPRIPGEQRDAYTVLHPWIALFVGIVTTAIYLIAREVRRSDESRKLRSQFATLTEDEAQVIEAMRSR